MCIICDSEARPARRAIALLNYARLAAQWTKDLLEGEMIETRGYKRDHLSFDHLDCDTGISQEEVGTLSKALNTLLVGTRLRISDDMGELVPSWAKRR